MAVYLGAYAQKVLFCLYFCLKDDPPSYPVATSGDFALYNKEKREKRKSIFGHKIPSFESKAGSDASLSLPPPKYTVMEDFQEDHVEIACSCKDCNK